MERLCHSFYYFVVSFNISKSVMAKRLKNESVTVYLYSSTVNQFYWSNYLLTHTLPKIIFELSYIYSPCLHSHREWDLHQWEAGLGQGERLYFALLQTIFAYERTSLLLWRQLVLKFDSSQEHYIFSTCNYLFMSKFWFLLTLLKLLYVCHS